MTNMRRIVFLFLALVLIGATSMASAQTYPSRLIRLIVPYAAGGNFDVIARLLAQSLSEEFKQSIVVENIAGANGNIGMAQLARSSPDGYTIGFVSNGTIAINPSLYLALGFDPKALTPITLVTSNAEVLVVRPNLPFRSMKEFIDAAKAKPGELNMANGGSGTLSHLSSEMLQSRSQTKFNIVPYKGTSLALNDLIGDHVDAMFDTIGTSLSFVKEGKLRALAVTGKKRSALLPELPTLMEVGVQGFSAEALSYLVGPPGLPDEIVGKLQNAVALILQQPEIKAKFELIGAEGIGSTTDDLKRSINEETEKWADAVKAAGIPKQ